jgi:subtilase family serine protease
VHSRLKPAAFFLILGLALSASSQTATNRITQAIDDRETRQLRGNVHPQLQHATDQGRMDGGLKMEGVSLVFKRTAAQEAAVEKLLAEQQNTSSPNYHKWLTPEQYADRFGLSNADVARVVAWLQAEGFTVNRVARGRTQVWFTGSVSQIETVFRTEMHRYTVKGEPHFANAVEPAVPAALAELVLGVHNLSDFRPRARSHVRKISAEEVKSNFTSSVSGSHFVAPDDFATIYDVKALYTAGFDGTGQRIAVAGQSAINTTDIDAFRSAAGLPARTAANFTQTLVPNSGTSTVFTGDVGESSLDLEWAEGVAKGVSETFVYVGNSQNTTVFDAFLYAIDNNLAPVISMSYGNCEQNLPSSFLTTVQQETQRANVQGQTIASASGDFGAADCGNPGNDPSVLPATTGLAVDIPGALPYVTSVGGTSFSGDLNGAASTYWNGTNNGNNGSALQYIPEVTWNDTALVNALSASGGGASVLFSKPSWQTGTGVPADGQRDVPDVSFAGDPNHDGYLLCATDSAAPQPTLPCTSGFRDTNGNLNVAGGTSFGAPGFAGVVAILNQKTGSRQGNVNPTLYALATADVGAFHDITTGTNIVPCQVGTPDCPTTGAAQYGFSAGTGYDQVTGLGSIDAAKLVNNWSSGNPTTADFSLYGNVVTIATVGGSGTSTITVDGRNGYAGSVSFTCTAPASVLIGCTISGSPVALNSSTTSGTVTLTVTTATHAGLNPNSAPFWMGSSGALMAGILVLGIPARKRRWTMALTLLTVALMAAAIGCGGSSSSSSSKSSGTPVGAYKVTVTATDGTTSHSTDVAVAVQ